MAQIPTADALPQTDAQPSISPVTYPRQFGRPNQVGEAVAEAGRGAMQAITQQKDQADAFDYAKARSSYLIGKVQLETDLTQNPNEWKDAASNYTDQMQQLQEDTAQTIKNPKYQRQFAMESGADFASGLNGIQKWQRGREVDDGRATLDTLADTTRQAALASPSTAPGLIASYQSALDGATAKGYITDVENVQQRTKFLSAYGKGYVSLLPDAQAVPLLQKSLPGLGETEGSTSREPASSSPNNLGNVKAPGGGFQQPATPVDGAILMANNLRSGYTGLTVSQIAQKWAPASDHNNPAQWAANVSKASGIDVNAVPDLNDPKQLGSLLTGIATAEKSPKDRANFTSDVINQGVTASLAGKRPTLGQAPAASMPANQNEPGAAPSAGMATSKTQTPIDFIDPVERVQMLREAQARLRSDGAANSQAFASSARDSIAYLQAGGDPSKVTMTPADITANVPKEEGQGLADEFGHAQDYNKAVRQIATATPDEIGSILKGHLPQGPTDFKENSATFQNLQAAAQARNTMIYGNGKTPGDPAGYAVNAMSDVGDAYANAQTTGKPQDFDAYVTRLNGAYGTLGVPPAMRPILPQANAQKIISDLQSKPPQEAMAQLSALKAEAGKWYPAVYRDLAKNGLPPSFQAMSVASPSDQGVILAAIQKDAEAKTAGKAPMATAMQGLKTGDGKSVTEAVEAQLGQNADLGNLRATFGVGGRAGVDTYTGVLDAVRTTALYLYAKGGITAEGAADKAAAMVTGPFDFAQQPGHPPARLPKGMTGDFNAATQHVIAGLDEKGVQPYAHQTDAQGQEIKATPEENRQAALQGAKNAYWVTIPGADGKGAIRAMDPQSGVPVRTPKGPLDIPFARLNFLANQARKAGGGAMPTTGGIAEAE